MRFLCFHRIVQPSPLLILEHFHHPLKQPWTHSSHPTSSFLVLVNCWSASLSIELSILDIYMKWNHVIYGLLWWLLSLSKMLRFICAVRCMHQYFIPFYGGIIFRWRDLPHFIYSFIRLWHLCCFCFLAITNSATMNTCVHIFAWPYAFISLGIYLDVELLGLV